MKRNRGDEPTGVIINIYMEMSKTPCVAILSKNVIFFFLLLKKSENRRVEQVLPNGGVGTSGRE
jgi:hypothetical protein